MVTMGCCEPSLLPCPHPVNKGCLCAHNGGHRPMGMHVSLPKISLPEISLQPPNSPSPPYSSPQVLGGCMVKGVTPVWGAMPSD